MKEFGSDIVEFGRTLGWYVGKKLRLFGDNFEGAKGIVVDILKARRGTYQKPFLHVGMAFLMVVAILLAPILAQEYPSAFASSENSDTVLTANQSDITNMDTVTKESEKPRKEVLEHQIIGGDTLSTIAKKYGVDVDSIVYLNDITVGKPLKPGEKIKIPPTSGIIVKVKSGETIATLAKKYGLPTAQPIVDWPYNEFANDETFALSAGQQLVIPGGKPPAEVPSSLPVIHTPSQALFAGGSGKFMWPTQGVITQYFNGFHSGMDIAAPIGTPIYAADSGRIESVIYQKTDYGIHIIINHGNGFRSLYGHLSRVKVSEGQNVGRGELIGDMGSTGRSTGPHLHFEIMNLANVRQNPATYLK